MTITNTDLNQSINAIFRDAVMYTESELNLTITNETTGKIIDQEVQSVNYEPNYAVLTYVLDSGDQFRDGDNYLVRIYNSSNELLYTDKMYVTAVSFDSSKQNIANSDYTFVNDSEDYTVIND